MSDWSIRRGRGADVPFLVNSWLKSYASTLRSQEKGRGFHTAMKEVIATLMDDSQVWVACHPEDDDIIMGWAMGEPARSGADGRAVPALLHYVYVKQVYRNAGIARDLVGRIIQTDTRPGRPGSVVVTHMTTPDVAQYCAAREWGTAYRLPWVRALNSKGKAA